MVEHLGKETKYQLNLLENALDFVLSAGERAVRDTPRDWKYSILDLANGVELLVKARLEMEHWTLLFANPDQANLTKLQRGDFTSVNFEVACLRLGNIIGIKIEEPARKHLVDLRKLRNQITHYSTELDSERAKSLVAKCLSFCITFCQQENMEVSQSQLGNLHQALHGYQEFVDERMKAIAPDLADLQVWECPRCWQKTVVGIEDDIRCKFCSVRPDPKDLAEYNTLGSQDHCSNCSEYWLFETVAKIRTCSGVAVFMCTYCGLNGPALDECFKCGESFLFSEDEDQDVWFCVPCNEHIMAE